MNLLEKYLKLVEPYRWSEMFVKWSFVSCVAAVLERKCWLDEEGMGYNYPNLYCVLVGPPASGKTSAAKCAIDICLAPLPNGPIMSSNQLTPASLIDELADAGKERYYYETAPLFAFAGEFGVLFKDIGGGQLVDLLLDFYDARKPGEMWRKNTKKWGKQEIPNPALTLLGCTTQDEIINSRLKETAGLGFISRVVFVHEPGFIANGNIRHRMDKAGIRDIQANFVRMTSIVGSFELAPDAREYADKIQYDNAEWLMNKHGATILSSYKARKPVMIRKIAMCFSAMRDNRKVILIGDLQRAQQLYEATEPTFAATFGSTITYRDPGLMTKLLNRIPIALWIRESDLLQAFLDDGQGVPYGYEFRDAVSGLVRSNQVQLKQDTKDGTILYRRNHET